MLFCSLYMFEKFYNYIFMLLRAWTGRTGPFISFRHNCVTTVPARLLPRCLHLFCKGTHLCESLTVLMCLSTLEGQTSSTLSSAQIQPLLRRSLCSANSPPAVRGDSSSEQRPNRPSPSFGSPIFICFFKGHYKTEDCRVSGQMSEQMVVETWKGKRWASWFSQSSNFKFLGS